MVNLKKKEWYIYNSFCPNCLNTQKQHLELKRIESGIECLNCKSLTIDILEADFLKEEESDNFYKILARFFI